MLKFIKNTFIVLAISLIILFILSRYDELILFYIFFSFLYVPLGGLILTILEYKFNLIKLKFLIVAIIVTIISFFITMAIIFNTNT